MQLASILYFILFFA